MMRLPRNFAGATLALAIALGLPAWNAQAQVSADPEVVPGPEASAKQPLSEGVIRLRRGGPSIDLDSLLDSNQPDFYLNVDIPAPEPTPTPAPSVEPSAAPAPEPTASASPEPAPSASPKPAKHGYDLMYQAQRLATLGQYRKALGLVDEAIAEDGEVAALHAVRGSLLVKLRDYPGAEEAWTQALVLDPSAHDVKAGLDWLRKRLAASGSAL
ncbi:hypothetical protein J7643_11885 [bacterium]|nr:hypothetical protein [bacterium]